jgi:hypothetical protein
MSCSSLFQLSFLFESRLPRRPSAASWQTANEDDPGLVDNRSLSPLSKHKLSSPSFHLSIMLFRYDDEENIVFGNGRRGSSNNLLGWMVRQILSPVYLQSYTLDKPPQSLLLSISSRNDIQTAERSSVSPILCPKSKASRSSRSTSA